MLPVTATTVAGYRSFREPTRLELAPLTLLYGWNNAGKSSLLRLLPLLADSVREEATLPIEAERVFDPKVTIRDLCFRGDPVTKMQFDLEFPPPGKLRRASISVSIDKLANRPFVAELSLYDDKPQPTWHAERVPPPSNAPWQAAQRYKLRAGRSPEKDVLLAFRGLLPISQLPLSEGKRDHLSELHKRLSALRSSVLWLKSQRSQSERYFPDTGRQPLVLSADGSDVPYALRADLELCRAVSGFFEQHFQRRLSCEEAANNQFQVLFRKLHHAEQAVDLVDMGQGVQNVLPILVAMERAQKGQYPIVAIEEPDANLHDNAQRWLGEHLCRHALTPSGPRVVLETHSQTLMLAVQLAVAKGELPIDRVRLYWVSEQIDGTGRAEPVTLNEQGEPEGRWPSGAFADRFVLARELIESRME